MGCCESNPKCPQNETSLAAQKSKNIIETKPISERECQKTNPKTVMKLTKEPSINEANGPPPNSHRSIQKPLAGHTKGTLPTKNQIRTKPVEENGEIVEGIYPKISLDHQKNGEEEEQLREELPETPSRKEEEAEDSSSFKSEDGEYPVPQRKQYPQSYISDLSMSKKAYFIENRRFSKHPFAYSGNTNSFYMSAKNEDSMRKNSFGGEFVQKMSTFKFAN